MLLCITICSINSGYDGSLINNLQALSTWQSMLGFPNASTLGIISASQSIGSWIGCLPSPYISDKYGRKWGIVVGGVVIFIGGLLQTFSYGMPQYIVGRICVGAGVIIGLVGGTSLTNELAHPRFRLAITGYFNVIWYLGSILASFLCYGLRIDMPNSDWQWRLPTILISFFGLCMVAIYPFSPESPRWLISQGRDDEAHVILAKYHANGDMEDELVTGEILEIKEALHTQQVSIKEAKTWKQCFGTPGDRWRMIICMGLATCNVWTGQQIVSYYNTQILTQAGITQVLPQLGINGGLSIFDLFAAILGAYLSGRVGRRPLFLACFLGMGASHVVVTALAAMYSQTTIPAYGYGVIAFIWMESGFYNIALNPLLYAYISEILTFSTRSKGVSLLLFVGDCEGIVARYVNPIGLANLGWKYYIVYLVFYIFEIIFVYYAFPETKGRTLEEIAEIFDGQQIGAEVVAAVEAGIRPEKADEAGEDIAVDPVYTIGEKH